MNESAEGSDRYPTNRFKRAAVFANPVSGGGKALKLLPLVEQLLHRYGLATDAFLSSSAADLESQVQREVATGADLLVSAGGDGTLHSLVNAAQTSKITFAVVPAGGGNDFARALGLPLKPIPALELALTGIVKAVDVVRVRNSAGHERLYIGGGGVGLDSDTAQLSSHQMRHWPGRLRYVAAAIRSFAVFTPRRVRIICEGPAIDLPWQKAIIASLLNSPTFGAGIRLVPEARIDDGFLDVVLREDLRFSELVRVLPRLISTGALTLPGMRMFRARKLRIETDPPVLFQGDGELLGYTPVELEVLPGAAKFLVPKSADS